MAFVAQLPPGFTEAVALDPASGKSVQVISGGKAGAQTVVLLRGLGQDASNEWLPVLPALAQDYHLHIVDLSNLAVSKRGDAAVTPKMADDLVARLIAERTKDPVILVAHSYSAAIALRYGYEHQQQVTRLLLIDAAGMSQPADKVVLAKLGAGIAPILRHVQVPVSMLWGAQDKVSPVRTGQALKALLQQARLDVLPSAGHVPMRDATEATAAWMLNALRSPTAPADAVDSGVSQGDGVCKNEKNVVFRGQWKSIRLDRCTNVRIENAALEQLVAKGSSVTIENTRIHTKGTAIEAKGGSIKATGLRIVAQRAVDVDRTRLDLAGMQLFSSEFGSDKGKPQLVASLATWCDGADEWRLQGALKLRKGVLDSQLRKQSDGACSLPRLR